mgnify:CR=1 FL=1
MFKPCFLNHDYVLDYNGNCQYKGQDVNVENGLIDIVVSGVCETFDVKKLGLFTHFRMNPFVVNFENVCFDKVDSRVLRLVCGHLPRFVVPVEIGYGFRIIPGFSNFAINEAGEVLAYRSGNILSENLNAYGYPCVSIYDPDKEVWRQVAVHILLARAFIANDDPTTKIYVNHKDGNKTNRRIDNLEWVTALENVEHAVSIGLMTPTNIGDACTIHDLLTGESKDFPSITSAMKAYEITRGFSGKTRLVNGQVYPRIYAKRYVITNLGESLKNVILPTGTPTSRSPNKGPYQALEISTGIVIECETLKQLAVVSEVPYDHVRSIVESSTPKKSKGYHFRVKSDEPWPDEIVDLVQLTPRTFEITNVQTNEVLEIGSLSQLADFLSTDKATIGRRLRDNKPFKNWSIRETSEKAIQSS